MERLTTKKLGLNRTKKETKRHPKTHLKYRNVGARIGLQSDEILLQITKLT